MIESPATLLEPVSFDEKTIQEKPRSTPVWEHATLAPGAHFRQYQLVRALSVTSGEADLWLVEHAETGIPYVLKYYRYGLFPKTEILERLRQAGRQHVIQMAENGYHAERMFEILEYIRHGSLEDWMKAGISSETLVEKIVEEISSAVAHLHSHRVLHRDIKPANILVRSRDPINLVLTDFGISSISETALHLTSKNRTPAYCAPEALTGIVTEASDWWSVGVIVLEVLLKHHPWRGLSEQMLNFQLVTKGLPVPETLDPKWQLLLKGLLTRDYSKRWSHRQVTAWLSGKRDLAVAYDEAEILTLRRQRPYSFAGTSCANPALLAEALALHWDEALKHWSLGYITRWVESEIGDQSLAAILREISTDPKLGADDQLAAALLAINPKLPLTLRGAIVDSKWCAENLARAIQLTHGSLPQWLCRLRNDSSLLKWREEFDELQQRLAAYGAPLDQQIIERSFAVDPAQVVASAQTVRREFAGSSHPAVAALLTGGPLDFTEALLLLACDRSILLTPDQTEHHRKLESLRSFGCYLDLPFAEKLLRADNFKALENLWRQAKGHYLLRRQSYIRFETDRIASILSQQTPELKDAIAVLANRLAFRNSLDQIFIPVPRLRVFFSLHPVRESQFRQFATACHLEWKAPRYPTTPDHPIVNVSWEDASRFCEWLTFRDREAGCIGHQDLYRLPTDLEWSAAAGLGQEPGASPLERAWKTKAVYPWGKEWPPPAHVGNFRALLALTSFENAAPVGSFPPNSAGIYDLGVNVMEWCQDWDDADERTKVVRGASWNHSRPDDFLSSARRFFHPAHRSENISFRPVLLLRSFKSGSDAER